MPTTVIQIEAKLLWSIVRDRDSDWLVAVADALPLTATGPNQGGLMEDMDAVLNDFFRYLLDRGELATFLESNHWTSNAPPVVLAKPPKHVMFQMQAMAMAHVAAIHA